MRRSTVVAVLVLAALLLVAGLVAHGRGGATLARWISLHRSNASH